MLERFSTAPLLDPLATKLMASLGQALGPIAERYSEAVASIMTMWTSLDMGSDASEGEENQTENGKKEQPENPQRVDPVPGDVLDAARNGLLAQLQIFPLAMGAHRGREAPPLKDGDLEALVPLLDVLIIFARAHTHAALHAALG